MAWPPYWINPQKKKQACTSYIFTMEKIYSGPSKLLVKGPSPYLLPIMMMHQVVRVGGGNTAANASMYCFRCLEVIMLFCQSQLTGICSLAKAVFEMRWEYGPCCLLFKRGDPSSFCTFGHDKHHYIWFFCITVSDIHATGSSSGKWIKMIIRGI